MYKINERKKATRDRFRQQAWDYFAIHASQRLTTFNFYLVIATLLTTGILASFQKQYEIRFAGIVLGLLLLIFSFVFWKLDQRNKHLIRHAEKALRAFENQFNDLEIPDEARLFTLAKEEKRIEIGCTLWFWRWELSYTNCFNFVFAIFAASGIFAILTSAFRTLT